ncbi:MAG TPA: Uma2 family endonuclease [Blastocatellia bacterium]
MSLPKAMPIPAIDYPESDGKPMAETDKHRDLISALIEALKGHFANDPQVYVSGNLLLYYVKGNPAKCVAPDVFVVRGVPKGDRRIYKLWEEGVPPGIVIEVSSRKTWREDWYTKLRLYEKLGVREYFIFDPEYDSLPEPLIGWWLEDGEYVPVDVAEGKIKSEVLRLELVDTGETLRLLDPQTGQYLQTPTEAMAEVARLREELARVRDT